MKRFLPLAAVLSLGLVAPAFPALAHPGHDEEPVTIPQGNAEAKAKTVVDTMIARDILEPSWRRLKAERSDLREGSSGGLEWVVVYRNPAAKDPAKRALYVFLSSDGIYLAANHTGK